MPATKSVTRVTGSASPDAGSFSGCSWYLEHPEMLPAGTGADPVTRVTDFVAGMTDRYALRTYREIFEPKEGPL